MPVNFHDLDIFAATARMGSITKAALSLGTVQSNVTGRIRLLEDELGTQLFHRHHNGVTLTPKGRELLPYAQQMTALLQKAREAVSDQKAVRGHLRIGSIQSTASARLPEILKAFVAKYDQVEIVVETGTPVELIDRVLDYGVDGAFVAGPVEHQDLHAVLAFVEELVVVTPTAFRSVDAYLARNPVPNVLVLKVGCTYRLKLERYLAQKGALVLNEMEFGTLDGIIGCVGAGLGLAMLPRSVVQRSARQRQVRIHPLSKEASRVETLFVTHKAQVVSSALERLLQLVAAG
jgi:DNA-binding transcriptional LysR family regulator